MIFDILSWEGKEHMDEAIKDFGDYTSEDILRQEDWGIARVEYDLKHFETNVVDKVMEIKGKRPLSDIVEMSAYPYGLGFILEFSLELFASGIELSHKTRDLQITPELLIDRVEIKWAVEVEGKEQLDYNREVEYEADFIFLDGSKIIDSRNVAPFYCLDSYGEQHKMMMKDHSPVKIVKRHL